MGLLNELSFEKELKPNIIVRQEKKMCDNIAIVGISLKGPKAENVEEFWKNISAVSYTHLTLPTIRLVLFTGIVETL